MKQGGAIVLDRHGAEDAFGFPRPIGADAMVNADLADARLDLWRSIFIAIMDDAPWAPVFNEQRFTMHSPNIAGDDSLFVDPVHIPVNYDHVYAVSAQ